MEQIRSFIALELPEELKQILAELEVLLKSGRQPSVRWVDPYSIHLTLKFLGDIPSSRIGAVVEAMEQAAAGLPPFCLEIGGLGVFPNLKRIRVIWVGLGGELERLAGFQRRIESNLANIGFPPEGRGFTPHLTLARVREGASPEQQRSLTEMLSCVKFKPDFSFTVDSVHLIKSQLTPEGAVYTRLSSVKLSC